MESESFEELYNESLKHNVSVGNIITGKIIGITKKGEIFVDLGYKADGLIPKNEFSNDEEVNPADEFKVGDEITAEVLKKNDGIGNVLLSYKKIRANKEREEFAKRVSQNEVFEGKINQINEKGIVTEISGTRVFIPISLSGIRRNENLDSYIGKKITFEIIEFDPQNRKIVGSHRIIAEKAKKEAEANFWNNIEEGKIYNGKVSSISSYGVFVDLNGVQGLLHVSELTWRRNANPNNYFKNGDEITVSIKSVDKENRKIQLAYDQKEVSPWENASEKYRVDEIVKAKVKKFATFGAFVELEEGIEGLVHISQITEERIAKPEQVLELGQEVEAKIIELDTENRKLQLSIKEAHANDWKNDISKIDGVTFE